MEPSGHLRIGELSRRSGVSPELLRAWERRYGLLEPTRTEGGLRLYSDDDLERVLSMQRHLAEGIAAAEAAALVSRSGGGVPAPAADTSRTFADLQHDLGRALSNFDEPGAQNVLDTLFAASTLDASLSDVVMPYLHELGDRWSEGDASVAEEHFASGVLRGRLLALARGWGRGLGPRIVLACVPGEQHDLGLIAFGLALRARGWRVVYLGADTPLESVATAARLSDPRFVVLATVDPGRFRANLDGLRELADNFALCLGGAGASEELDELAAWRLTGDPVDAAERLTALAQAGR